MRALLLLLAGCAAGAPSIPPSKVTAPPMATGSARERATEFLTFYNGALTGMTAELQEVEWKSQTDVSDEHTGGRIGAESVMAGFTGSKLVIDRIKELLTHEKELDDLTMRQLRFALLEAANAPATNRELLSKRIAAEARQSKNQDSFVYCLDRGARGGGEPPLNVRGKDCAKTASANDLDDVLKTSRDLAVRERTWSASKEIGVPLRPGILELRDLRNATARELGYSDFYSLQIADYGMSTAEMMSLLDASIATLRPLFVKLHCFARRTLAQRYKQPEPKLLPAHWMGNRWAQYWPGLVASTQLDATFEKQKPEWFTQTAEGYYVSMGFPKLPSTFWEKSDLFPVKPGDPRKKNSHATAWHMDLGSDVRSLMSIKPNEDWFLTAHHELGHIYYYVSYTRPEVPPILRRGANRAFHEAVGELISLSVRQAPYLDKLGLSAQKLDPNAMLLDDALLKGVVFLMFSAGTMSHFEHDLYAGNLPAGELNARWWNLVEKYQGVVPPKPRDESTCDACTKTHINDDPAQYYDYALATLIKHQLHEHLCKNIVKADPHACTYAGNAAVGDALRKILSVGATRDWRALLEETTGEKIGAAAIARYYAPLEAILDKELAGAQCSL